MSTKCHGRAKDRRGVLLWVRAAQLERGPCKPQDSIRAEISKPCGRRGELWQDADGAGTCQHGAGCGLAAAPRPYRGEGPRSVRPARPSSQPARCPCERLTPGSPRNNRDDLCTPHSTEGPLCSPPCPDPAAAARQHHVLQLSQLTRGAGGCPAVLSAGAVGWQPLPSPPGSCSTAGATRSHCPQAGSAAAVLRSLLEC